MIRQYGSKLSLHGTSRAAKGALTRASKPIDTQALNPDQYHLVKEYRPVTKRAPRG